ncbi:MAG: hypothetical protein K8S25_04365 [Alphaproteobacteria bacterium]|nr:hypothetical protein [Alphaproteobacteria bacterium]
MKFVTGITAAIAGLLSLSGVAYADVIPRGSYQQSCSDFYTDGTTLSATCRKRYGESNYTTLRDYNDCRGDIANVDGRLKCVEDWDDDQNDDDDNDHDGGWTPRGSYRDTCRRIDVDGRTLQAECEDRNGRWRYTELNNFRSCRGDIYNQNGILGCRRDDDDDDNHGGYGLPGGNWRMSCRNSRVYGRVLYAQCRDAFGRWQESSLDLRQCSGDVSNWRGRLVCAQGGGYGRITLYKHSAFGGASRTYATDVPDLNPYAFGNQTSSVVIQGGVWQLCDKPNYRGFCIVLDRTAPNLFVYGFNDRAESIRRLR